MIYMKIHLTIFGIIATSFFTQSNLLAETTDLKIKLDEIRELLKPVDSDSPETKQIKDAVRSYPDQWQTMIDQGNFSRFSEYSMQGMSSSFSKIPGLPEKIQELSRGVVAEAEKRNAAKITEAKALISQAGETLKDAKKAEELDGVMLALSKSQLDEYGNNPDLRAISRELQATKQIVGNWQEYLIAEETGNFQNRRSNLEQISSQLASTPILPRSIVLRLLNKPAPKSPEITVIEPKPQRVSLDGIRQKLTESGDIVAAAAEIKAIPKESIAYSDDSSFAQFVMSIEVLHRLEPTMSESEVFANIRNIGINHIPRQFTFNKAIDQIALNAIAKSYGMETQSAKTTTARKVLESIAMDAAAGKDWKKLRRAIESLDSYSAGSVGSDNHKRVNDLKILSLIELGEAAEKREDIDAAANAYIEASLIDGQYLQRGAAYLKIADLKQKSPERVGDMLAKAEKIRREAEVARRAAEVELQDRMMSRRHQMPVERLSREDLAALRPVIQEVVAEFLKEKRLEQQVIPEVIPPEK